MFTLANVEYDGWKIYLTPLHGMTGEIFDPPTRTVLIDPVECGLEKAAAHAVAHLRLKHHLTAVGDYTEAHCDEADREADKVLRASAWRLEPLTVPLVMVT